ncbi:MAG: ABC transporter permease [Acidobacteriota bacterium]
MNKVWVIIKREYMVRVKTRAFLIGTILSPVLLLALVLLPGFLATRGGGQRRVTVINQTGDAGLFDSIKAKMEERSDEIPTSGDQAALRATEFTLTHVVAPAAQSIQELAERYAAEVRRDSSQTFVILPANALDGGAPQYYARNISDFSIRKIERSISSAIIERRFARVGFDKGRIEDFTKPVDMETNKVTDGEIKKEEGSISFIISFVMLFFIYMSVLFYGIFVMRGVIEEKQSRISEVLVSSIKPTQMMLGKLVGIGLVGLTQMGIWALTAMGLTVFGVSLFASRGINFPQIPPMLFVYFVIYFVLGYFLFATLYALVGSTVSSEDEAQQAQMPVTMLLVVPMIIFTVIMNNPNSPLSTGLSMIPFFAPTLMMMRISVVNPPVWQILLSMAIMVATILGCVWVAGRIYRVGILMYGKRPSIAELGRWLRYT